MDSWGFLFGLVNERIGDLHSLRIGKGIIGRNHVSEMPVLQPSAEDIDRGELNESCVALKSSFDKSGPLCPLTNRWSSVYHAFQIGGRLSSMAKQQQQRVGLLQGTLDMLILRTLLYGPAHGHQIGKHIQRTTNEFLQMQHGSLYPALHRLERRGWVVSKWETAPDRNREFKYYRLTDKGRKQLLVEESQWKQMAEAVARVMWPAAEEN